MFALLSPLVLLIDHGHFQFNNLVGGLLWLTVWLMLDGQLATAAVTYTLALNFKQTAIFYSLPIFGYYLGCILTKSKLLNNKKLICYPATTMIFSFFYYCFFYAIIVALITAILWMPWIISDRVF